MNGLRQIFETERVKKDKRFKQFIADYFNYYTYFIGIVLCLLSFFWLIKDICIIGFDGNLFIDVACRISVIIGLPFILSKKVKNTRKWIILYCMGWVSVFSQFYMNNTIFSNRELTGEGWISFYLLFFFISLITSHNFLIDLSYVCLSITILISSSEYGGSCNYGVNILRPLTTGIIMAFGFMMVSYIIKTCFIELYKKEDTLKDLSKRDTLSGLYNRAKINDLINPYGYLHREGTVFLFDVDKFKSINDSYGHNAGDNAIIITKNCLLSCFRCNDCVIRYGGDEFLVITDGFCNEEEMFERIGTFLKGEENIYNITFSCGSKKCSSNEQLFDAIKKADDCAYLSKKNGRNRLTVFEKASIQA